MQKVAGYLMERRVAEQSPGAAVEEVRRSLSVIEAWLQTRKRGAAIGPDLRAGTYVAEDGQRAQFSREEARDGDRTWNLLKLDETSRDGLRFATTVSITNLGHSVAVYVALEAGSNASTVAPVYVDPRTPTFVRDLLKLSGDWYHGATRFEALRTVRGQEAGDWLAAQLEDERRTIPIVLFTEDSDGLALPEIDKKVAYDLCGLANIYRMDSDACWALTDAVGRAHSCHSGAVRIYWPRFSVHDSPYNHPLWLAARLRGSGDNAEEVTERFRRQLRGLVMNASARSVVRPREIDDIRAASSSRHYAELRSKASSVADFEALADEYAIENDNLRAGVAQLQSELDSTRARLEAALAQLQYREQADLSIAPDQPEVVESDARARPVAGEVRFYKKTRSTPNYDIVVSITDCEHNRWQNAHSGEKARKGIERYEGATLDNLWHCGTCTGGGVWKVRW